MRDAAPIRDKPLDLESQIGRVTVVQTNASGRSEVGAFVCDVCNCTLRDNIAYLDHMNGRNHLRMMGFSARTEQVTVADVRAKLASLKRKREEISSYDLDARVKQLQEEEMEAKRQKREEKKQRDDQARSEARKEKEDDGPQVVAEEIDPDLAAMGLPTNFGSSN